MILDIKKIKKTVVIAMMFSLVWTPFYSVQAAMKSTSYIIYENVLHTFDGPVITGVSSSVSGITVTVTWNTNVLADGFVVYDTVGGFTASKEQGRSVKDSTSHSVTLNGLAANTTYFYKAKSTRINGGVSESSSYNFTTGADPNAQPPTPPTPPTPPPSAGGGMLIIDKTDKKAPIITDVTYKVISSVSAEIKWVTDESATGFVEYGETTNYGSTFGSWSSSTTHTVLLDNLLPFTTYHFRAVSSDSWGNVGHSDDFSFTTQAAKPEEQTIQQKQIDQKILAEVTRRVLEFLRRLFPTISLNKLGANPFESITSIDQLANFIPAPVMSGEPKMDVGATEAKISWTTDIDANGVVAMAPDNKYDAKAAEPYIQIIGNADIYAKDHAVTIIGLTPDTLYHVQLRSKAKLGPTATSKDFTFRTKLEELEITSYFTQIIDLQTAAFKWVTNKSADSAVKITPYLNNQLTVDQAKTFKDNATTIIHEIKISEFLSGTSYEIEISSTDNKGNTVTKVIPNFTTGKDETPPEISGIKAESTIFLDKKDKTQTVITWATNEPATSKIFYQEGVHGGDTALSESTTPSDSYTKEHVIVITKFKVGTVYTFKVESADSSGNTSTSSPHTFMTAKQKESIIQIIMRILENTFGWIKNING
jgi:hypothetical protein